MIINCFRCGKSIESACDNNADYVIAEDTIETETIENVQSEGIVMEQVSRDTQKTGLICPDCYKPTDSVIWGVHKAK